MGSNGTQMDDGEDGILTIRVMAVLWAVWTGAAPGTGTGAGGRRAQPALELVRRAVAGAAVARGGRLIEEAPDGVGVVFPTAFSALDAAAALHRGAGALAAELDIPIALRIGIAVGEMSTDRRGDPTTGPGDDTVIDLTGEPVVELSSRTTVPGKVVGPATDEAIRVTALAAPGGTVCTDAVRLLTRNRARFTFDRIAAVTPAPSSPPDRSADAADAADPADPAAIGAAAPGREPPTVHRVWYSLAQSLDLPEALDAVHRFRFVGRRGALEALARTWTAAASGDGAVTVLAGEPGIGKTRLCREHARHVRAAGGVVLYGRFREDLGRPFDAFVQALRRVVIQAPRAADLLPAGGGELVRVLPELQTLLPDLTPAGGSDPETERYRLLDALVAWIGNLSRQVTVLLVLDDLTWADESSLALLRLLARQLAGMRLSVVASYRPMDARPASRRLVEELQRLRPAGHLPLGGLNEAEVVEFGRRILGGELTGAQTALVSEAGERAAGSPLFLGELLLGLRDVDGNVGGDATDDGREAPASPSAGATATLVRHAISPPMADLVRARLDRMPAPVQEALRVASVIGVSFPAELLVAAVDHPPHDIAAALDRASEANLLHAAQGADDLEFTHALVRDAIYDSLGALRRKAEHHRIGAAIERTYAHDLHAWAEAAAFHYERGLGAEDATAAVRHYRTAADEAVAQTANEEAADLYRRAEELLDRSSMVADERFRCELQTERGWAEQRAGREAGRRTLGDAAERALRLGLADLAVRAALGAGRGVFGLGRDGERMALLERTLERIPPDRVGDRVRVLAALSAELGLDDDPKRAELMSDEAITLARELGDPGALVSALRNRLVALWRPDRVHERLRIGAELDALRRRSEDGPSGQFVVTSALYCQAATEVGDLRLADRLLAWMQEAAATLRHPVAARYVDLRRATRACMQGEFAEAERLAMRTHDATVRSGHHDAETFLVGQLVGQRFHEGRLAELVERIEAAEVEVPTIPAYAAGAACAAAELGDVERCRAALGRFGAHLETLRFDVSWLTGLALASVGVAFVGDRTLAVRLRTLLDPYRDLFVDNASTCLGLAAHFQGLLSATLGEGRRAEVELRRALAEHRRVDAPPLLARTALELALVLRATGDAAARAEAEDLLAEAHGIAGRLGMASIRQRLDRADRAAG